jgi:hypothetical protein
METKLCPSCNETKPLDKFYFHHSSGKHEKRCKKCKLARQKKYNNYPSVESGVPHENDIIQKLRSIGIYACSGKRSRARWVDIMVFGCVGVEAKLATKKGNSYSWTFTSKQVQQGIRGDIVIFMIDHDNRPTDYFVVKADSPFIRHGNGDLKESVNYTPDSNHALVDQEFNEFMEESKNYWDLIQYVFDERIQQMLNGTFEDVFTETLPPVTRKRSNHHKDKKVS